MDKETLKAGMEQLSRDIRELQDDIIWVPHIMTDEEIVDALDVLRANLIKLMEAV